MKKILLIFMLFLSYLSATNIDDKSSNIDILSSSEIFIDYSKKLTIDKIIENKVSFSKIDSSTKKFGYSPDFKVWIKFTLHNIENEAILKIIEFDNPLVTNINFYENNNLKESEGLLNKNIERKSVNPVFHIKLEKDETKTYYIEASSKKTSLSLKLNLYSYEAFYKQEIIQQIILSLFFGGMIVLALYNLSIYFMIKDISYFYYVGYIITLVFHHLLYVGFANLYLFDSAFMEYVVRYAAIFIALPVLFLALFSKSFLQINQYPKINFILNILIALLVSSVILFIFTNYLEPYRNVISIFVMLYLFFITFYTFLNKNEQAKLILFGWTAILFAGSLMYLSSSGIIEDDLSSYYIIEIAFILEALVFSIALANRIKRLQDEKEKMQLSLITEQKENEARLNKIVSNKTNNLIIALEEKEILLKELNHRVKNNMQTIISLIRLQNDEINDSKINILLTTIQNRISAMSHLHELLYQKDTITFVDANEYFEKIISEIKQSFEHDIDVVYDINCNLSSESAIYCGLILNELLTNSFKHAFDENKTGIVNISFFGKNKEYKLVYSDNGKGYNPNIKKSSLGLTLIETLAKKQLKAEMNISTNEGVKVKLRWKE
ncbi:7TM diverse intracellular signaling domain-containing protein [Aliarcobacter cryaerophilus]|uniref:histidine kinase n=1 Tax=Aliarcobacter cryaerophilus TaxID=28198 RepID=A0A5C0E1R4_9BACT|nr:7TM diverse intracellular signaling domain-containing protein [Aliarcobacter cryaerophilus]QEI46255.1 7TMR-DISM-7TM/7TMR-DISMED2 domain-containing signal transduction protein [Aliarcobacter cryaerophilus]